MDKSKRDIIIFSQLVGTKMAHAVGRKRSSEWSTKTTKRSGLTCYKSRGGYHGLCPVAFVNGVYEPMDLDINIGKDNEIFSSHWRLKAYISAN